MSLAVSQNTPTAAIWLYLQMMHSLLKWGPYCIMTPSTRSVISIWAGGAAIIPVNKEASGIMSVRRLPLFSLHIRLCCPFTPAALVDVDMLFAFVCDGQMFHTCHPPVSSPVGRIQRRPDVLLLGVRKRQSKLWAARRIITLLHCLHDRVSMITFITFPFFYPPPSPPAISPWLLCAATTSTAGTALTDQIRGREDWFNVVLDRRLFE